MIWERGRIRKVSPMNGPGHPRVAMRFFFISLCTIERIGQRWERFFIPISSDKRFGYGTSWALVRREKSLWDIRDMNLGSLDLKGYGEETEGSISRKFVLCFVGKFVSVAEQHHVP